VAKLKADFHSVEKVARSTFCDRLFQPHPLRLIACISKESGRKKSIALKAGFHCSRFARAGGAGFENLLTRA
jgi:hypothetical protein